MATPSRVVWDRDPHTAAKHDLLRRYFAAWLPILLTQCPRITYAEGFAGPGVYQGGEPGSPVIALEVIATHRKLLQAYPHHSVDVLFVEERGQRCDRLQQELARARSRLGAPPTNVKVHSPVRGDCAERLPALLADVGAWGHPMFVVLDSFGGPDVPFEMVRRIAENRSGEVLVTYGPSFLTRHGGSPQHAESGDLAFGGSQWRGVFEQPPDHKRRYLVEAYRDSLHRAGFAYTLGFEMVDERSSQLWLMFGTNSRRGVGKMKDAMWAVDPAYGVRYRDPRDPDQMTLDIAVDPDTAPLSRMLLDALAPGPRTLADLREFALLQTVYRPQQVRAVVQRLLASAELERDGGGHLAGTSLLRRASVARTTARQQQLALEL